MCFEEEEPVCSPSFEALASQGKLSFLKVIKLMAGSESQKS